VGLSVIDALGAKVSRPRRKIRMGDPECCA